MCDQDQLLYEQFLQLLDISEKMQNRIIELEKTNQVLLKSQKQFAQWLNDELEDMEHFKENIRFELLDIQNTERNDDLWYPQILPIDQTLKRLVYEKASLARFGDGEFSAIQGQIRHRFQNIPDQKLSDRLKEVLKSEEENMLIGIADNYGNLDQYSIQAKREIRNYMTKKVRMEHLNLLSRNKKYHNAYITRPYVMYCDNQTDAPAKRFENLKKIWNLRECIFVEGEKTGLGVGNDLFDNTVSIKRIIAPAENAFSKYEQILSACIRQPKDCLFLLSLGPTATVLAYDLYKSGYQAIDIGHIDLEYEWFLKGLGCRTQIENKYNNEMPGGENSGKIEDIKYYSEIIDKIK